MKAFNLNSDEWDGTRDREGWRVKGALVGQTLALTNRPDMSEVEPGCKLWPYHTHYMNEEWVIVLRGVQLDVAHARRRAGVEEG